MVRLPRRVSSRLLTATVLLGAASWVACDGQGSGLITGERLILSSCEELDVPRTFEPYEMRLSFMGLVRERERVQIRMSRDARFASEEDQLVVFVPDLAAARRAIREEGRAVLPLAPGVEGDDSDARVGLSLHRTCPEAVQPLVSQVGEVVFTHLGPRKGDRVAGTLDFELEDKRTGEVVGEGFEGRFDFDVRVGIPNQHFSDPHGQAGEPAGTSRSW